MISTVSEVKECDRHIHIQSFCSTSHHPWHKLVRSHTTADRPHGHKACIRKPRYKNTQLLASLLQICQPAVSHNMFTAKRGPKCSSQKNWPCRKHSSYDPLDTPVTVNHSNHWPSHTDPDTPQPQAFKRRNKQACKRLPLDVCAAAAGTMHKCSIMVVSLQKTAMHEALLKWSA